MDLRLLRFLRIVERERTATRTAETAICRRRRVVGFERRLGGERRRDVSCGNVEVLGDERAAEFATHCALTRSILYAGLGAGGVMTAVDVIVCSNSDLVKLTPLGGHSAASENNMVKRTAPQRQPPAMENGRDEAIWVSTEESGLSHKPTKPSSLAAESRYVRHSFHLYLAVTP